MNQHKESEQRMLQVLNIIDQEIAHWQHATGRVTVPAGLRVLRDDVMMTFTNIGEVIQRKEVENAGK